ncbi:hypothetical protein A9Q99_23085 [Gammaproteobacteria bacterium 45_16_T64]|nr:hypothetical protein A9Q99_23085 [Gammaproteobacteria bacterium 45_16_T64]
MKRSLLTVAVSASIVAPSFALADGPQVYGRMDMSLDYVAIDDGSGSENDTGSNWAVESNASRFGVKGDAELMDGLKAIYKIEWQVDGDGSDSANRLKERNRYVGLVSNFGGVTLGYFDTPLKKAQGKVDLFGDHAGDVASVVEGEQRGKNTIQFQTPKIADSIIVKLALIQQEENEVGATCSNIQEDQDGTDCEDGLFDAYSASVTFSQGGIYAALATDSNVSAKMLDGNSGRVDSTRVVAGFKLDAVKIGVLYNLSEEDSEYAVSGADLREQTGYVLSGAFTVGKTVFKGQYGASVTELDNDDDEIEISMVALGVEQKFTKQTKAYAEYVALNTENAGFVDGVDEKENTLSVGIQHNF